MKVARARADAVGADDHPAGGLGFDDAEQAADPASRESLEDHGGDDDRVGEGLEEGGVGVVGQPQREDRGHGGGDDAAWGDPAEEEPVAQVEAAAEGGQADVERPDDEHHREHNPQQRQPVGREFAEFEVGRQQDEEQADEEVLEFLLVGDDVADARRFADAEDEPGHRDAEQSALGDDEVGQPEAQHGGGEGEGVDVVLADHVAPQDEGERLAEEQAERPAEREAHEEVEQRVAALAGADVELEAENGDEDADRIDQHPLPVQDVVQLLAHADALEQRPDHGRAGDDDEAGREQAEAPFEAEHQRQQRRATEPRDQHPDGEHAPDLLGHLLVAADVEREAAFEQDERDSEGDDHLQAGAEVVGPHDAEEFRAGHDAADQQQHDGGDLEPPRHHHQRHADEGRDHEGDQGRALRFGRRQKRRESEDGRGRGHGCSRVCVRMGSGFMGPVCTRRERGKAKS